MSSVYEKTSNGARGPVVVRAENSEYGWTWMVKENGKIVEHGRGTSERNAIARAECAAQEYRFPD